MLLLYAALLQIVAPVDTTVSPSDPDLGLESSLEAMEEEEEDDAASFFDLLEDAAQWKIQVNTASVEALRGVPGISELDVRRILEYRENKGAIHTPADLLSAGLSAKRVESILPFVAFDGISHSRPIRLDVIQRWGRRLETGRGFKRATDSGSAFAGSPVAAQTRVRAQLGERIAAGFTLDKDPGEPSTMIPFHRSRWDYANVHVAIHRAGPFEQIVVGGYSLQAGEGLVLGQGMTGMTSLRKTATGRVLRPHTSAREYAYFRGVALQVRMPGALSSTTFASRQMLDGRTDTVSGSWQLAGPGLHRTNTELNGRRSIQATTWGGVVSLDVGLARFGLVGVSTRYGMDRSIRTTSSFSLFGGWSLPNWTVTTEVVPRHRHAAFSAVFSPAPDAGLAVRLRRTSRGDIRLHTSMGTDSRRRSIDSYEWEAETGFRPLRAWRSGIRYRERRRTDDNALRLMSRSLYASLDYRPHDWLHVLVRGVSRTTDAASRCRSGMHELRCMGTARRHSIRLQLRYEHSDALRSTHRLELVRSNSETSTASRGTLLYSDMRWRLHRRVQIDLRYALFESSDGAARIVAFENDVLYAFSAPSFSGRGRRRYVLVRYELSGRLVLQMKLGSTAYEDVMTVGSGHSEVDGHRVHDFRVQIRWKLG